MRRVNRKKGRFSAPELLLFLLVGAVGLILVLGGLVSDANADNNNKNPRQGRVDVADYVYKLCDEKNLIYIYRGEGIFVTPNSRQCT